MSRPSFQCDWENIPKNKFSKNILIDNFYIQISTQSKGSWDGTAY